MKLQPISDPNCLFVLPEFYVCITVPVIHRLFVLQEVAYWQVEEHVIRAIIHIVCPSLRHKVGQSQSPMDNGRLNISETCSKSKTFQEAKLFSHDVICIGRLKKMQSSPFPNIFSKQLK